MSPTKFLDGDHKQHMKSGIIINGPRPSSLKIKQESHTIHKQHQHQHQKQKQIKKPIIIYMRSPKVIHTKPHEFMALVQKLTGRASPKDQKQQQKETLDDSEFYNHSDVTHEKNSVMKSQTPMFNSPLNRYGADAPLFTPNTSDYFFSPESFLRLSDVVSSSPNKRGSFSPGSLVEFMKGLPEY